VIVAGSNKIILDAYNANPSSMQAAIRNFMNLKDPNKYLILGDMFELGEESDAEHENVIVLLKELMAENVLLAGKDFHKHKTRGYRFFEETSGLREFLLSNPISNSTILIKGSRGMRLESIMELF
jgi:UDP-N-acetylmuramoyl-tripeptide--D-alanyl-D-alanine ligase